MLELVIVGASLWAFALVSRRLEGSMLTAPMLFTAVGLTVGITGLGVFDLEVETEAASILIEATLVLVLFSDAARMNLSALTANAGIPVRLLGVGLPLTILTGAAAAWWIFEDLDLVEAALLAAVLTPTDAALGQPVVTDQRLPARVRQSLNVESGINDGIMVPIFTVLLAAAALSGQDSGATGSQAGAGFAAAQIGFGVVAGVLVGSFGGWSLAGADQRGVVTPSWRQIAALAIAATAYAAAEVAGGNGFVSAFVAGLAFDRAVGQRETEAVELAFDVGDLLTAVTFFLFGAVLAGPLLGELTPAVAGYAVLSLTLVRMAPTLIAMWGSNTMLETRLFLGWFGPRGLASILFAILIAEEAGRSDASTAASTVLTVASWTILLSVFAHGVTAGPWTRRLSRVLSAREDAVETGPAVHMPTRGRSHGSR